MSEYEDLIYRVARHVGIDADTEEGYVDAMYIVHAEGLWDDEGLEVDARRRFFGQPTGAVS